MPDEGTQGTATAAGGDAAADTTAAQQPGDTNAAMDRIMREAPRPGKAGGPDERQPAAKADGGAEELLADAIASGDGDGKEDPLAKAVADAARWKAQARENEKRAKLNAEKAKNYDAYEESQKTEQQRLTDQLAAAQAEATQAREDRFRLLAAAQYDLPPSLIGHLGGGTEDEITERAEAFAQAINERAEVIAAATAQAAAQQQPRNGGGGFRPVESLRPGALPASDSKPADANAWFRGMVAATKQRP